MEPFKSFEPSKCHLGVRFGKVGDQVGRGHGKELDTIN